MTRAIQSRQTIQGYELLERIGSGGFGAVYRAYQSPLGREVAVKIILPTFANHPEFIRAFVNIGQRMSEDGFVNSGKNPGQDKSLEQKMYPNMN